MMQVTALYNAGSVNPLAWTRAILMDLGFGGLIEEIEKRFGKFPTTLLIGILFVGIVLWTFNQTVLLFAETGRLAATGSTGDFVLAVLYRAAFWIVLFGLGFGFLKLFLKRENQVLDDRVKEWQEKIEALDGHYAQMREENREVLAQAEAIIDEWRQASGRVKPDD